MPTEEERRHALAVVAVELGAEVARLAAVEQANAEALGGLRTEFKNKARTTTIKLRWMVALVVLCLVLSGGLFVGCLKIADLVKSQEVVKAQVLCPLYRLLLGGYQPWTRTPGADRDKYEATFKDMWGQYAALNCAGALVPPRSDLVTTTPPGPR